MKNAIKICFIILSFATFSMLNAGEITKSNVEAIIKKVDSAILTLDANKISDSMSDNIVIIMNVTMEGKKHVIKPSKKEYLAMLQQGWDIYKNYTYKKSNIVIKIEGNRAVVTSDVSESMTVNGKKMSGESKEEITITLINGKPLITKVVGYTTM